MIPLFKVGMHPQAAERVKEVLDSGYVGQGRKVEEFEADLWKTIGDPSVAKPRWNIPAVWPWPKRPP